MDDQGNTQVSPDMVPLLDVVFQLIMFFMITMRFIQMGQMRHEIQLPVAQEAIPLDQPVADWVFINVNGEGKIVGTKYPVESPGALKKYLNDQYNALLLEKRERDVNFVVVIRADENVPYQRVFEILDACQRAGYRSWQLRVRTSPGRGG